MRRKCDGIRWILFDILFAFNAEIVSTNKYLCCLPWWDLQNWQFFLRYSFLCHVAFDFSLFYTMPSIRLTSTTWMIRSCIRLGSIVCLTEWVGWLIIGSEIENSYTFHIFNRCLLFYHNNEHNQSTTQKNTIEIYFWDLSSIKSANNCCLSNELPAVYQFGSDRLREG